MKRRKVVLLGCALAGTLLGGPIASLGGTGKDQSEATPAQEAVWKTLQGLVGAWEGTGEGKPGKSRLTRKYEMILQSRYLLGTNKSVFDPQPSNPSGENHEDWAIFSYDKNRQKVVIRQFNSEGFVNRFVLDQISDDGNTLVFTTEDTENSPPRLRARMTYRFKGNDEFSENFELAFDGQSFQPCVNTHLQRTKE